jgi:hypothetical protein
VGIKSEAGNQRVRLGIKGSFGWKNQEGGGNQRRVETKRQIVIIEFAWISFKEGGQEQNL